MENVCKNLDNSKYCHNYIITTESDIFENSEETFPTNVMQFNEKQLNFKNNLNPNATQNIFQSLEEKIKGRNLLVENLDLKALPKLSDIYLRNNAYLRNLHNSLSNVLLSDASSKKSNSIDVIQVMILLYLRVRFGVKIKISDNVSSWSSQELHIHRSLINYDKD